jgi:LytR cell envelope-related transcriptional attenuator
VKQRNSSDKQSTKPTGKTANIFLNLIIALLTGLIIFMSLSLFTKVKALSSGDDGTEPKPSKVIQLEVLNGCGIGGVADKITSYLRQNNFDVVQMGNYTSFDIDNTLVVDRTGKKINAFKVAEALGIDPKNVIQQINNDYFLDVSLIIGRDFNHLKPFKN